jgi:hypothetical protein
MVQPRAAANASSKQSIAFARVCFPQPRTINQPWTFMCSKDQLGSPATVTALIIKSE